MSETDRIEKVVILNAPVARVWRAVSDAHAFGAWFGVELEGPFVAGTTVRGRVVPTQVDEEIAKAQEPYAGITFVCVVETVEPQRRLSFRWHPGAEQKSENSNDPMTLVVFELEALSEKTRLTITESGFDQIPLEQRAKVFASNNEGWSIQTRLIAKYLAAEQAGPC